MKKIKTKEVIEKWANEYMYKLDVISFSQEENWLIIDLECDTIILSDTKYLIKDINNYFNNAELYSIESTPGEDNELSIWIKL